MKRIVTFASQTRKAVGVAISGLAFNAYAYVDAGHWTKGITKGLIATAVGVAACYGLTNEAPADVDATPVGNPQGTTR